MTSLHPNNIDKPVETIHQDHLPDASVEHTGGALESLVEHSVTQNDVGHGIHAPMQKVLGIPFLKKLIPGLEDLATKFHVGNYGKAEVAPGIGILLMFDISRCAGN